MERKPIIGITSSYVKHTNHMEGVYVHHDYHRAVIEAGGIPVILPIAPPEVLDTYISMCDGFIFSGGEDVDPQFYNQDPHQKLGFFYTERDESELYLMKEVIKVDKPLLGICRGMQLLNVALGGTLVQDIPTQLKYAFQHVQTINRDKQSHDVFVNLHRKLYDILEQDEIRVNSLHHQALDKIADDLLVVAISSDEIVEAVEHKDARFVLGLQWHPESLAPNNMEAKKLFREFINKSSEK